MSKLFIVPILCIVLIAAGCDSGPTMVDSSQTIAATTAQVSDTGSLDTASPDNTDQPQDTSSVAPDDTSSAAPDDTSTADPSDTSTTAPQDTSQDNATATPQATATPSGTAGSPSTLDVKAITGKAQVTRTLSLRASASTASKALALIKNDETFTILSVSTNKAWLKVKYSGMDGFVLAKYVLLGSSSTDKVCTVTSTTLNVRSKASKTGKIVGLLAKGDTLIVTSVVSTSSDTWCKISVDGSTAYIDAKYCRLSTDS